MRKRRQNRAFRSGGRTPVATRRLRRSAVIIFELIVSLPILLIFLAAVVEFGVIFVGIKQVALASRAGAKVAAEAGGLNTAMTSSVAMSARDAADRQLETAGFGPDASAGLTLRHNVSGGGVSTQGNCADPTFPALPSALPTSGSGHVRVTVCIDVSKLAPDLLSMLGFSIAGFSVEETSTYPHEGS